MAACIAWGSTSPAYRYWTAPIALYLNKMTNYLIISFMYVDCYYAMSVILLIQRNLG